jgi:hypothetical protein
MLLTEFLLDAKTREELTWNNHIKRYVHTSSGKTVSEREMYLLIKREGAQTKQRLDSLVTDLLDGKKNFTDWQKESATVIKDAHVDATRLGRGGRENTYGIHYLETGNELRKNQYPAFRRLANQMSKGELSEAQIRARVASYADSAKISYEKAKKTQMVDKGDAWGRRRLGQCANHCDQCIEYAEQGWVPIDQVVPPGVDCDCRGNCCCSVETSRYKRRNSKTLYKE